MLRISLPPTPAIFTVNIRYRRGSLLSHVTQSTERTCDHKRKLTHLNLVTWYRTWLMLGSDVTDYYPIKHCENKCATRSIRRYAWVYGRLWRLEINRYCVEICCSWNYIFKNSWYYKIIAYYNISYNKWNINLNYFSAVTYMNM